MRTHNLILSLTASKIILSICNSICWCCYYCHTMACDLFFFLNVHWNSFWTVINQYPEWDIASQNRGHTRAMYFLNIEFEGAFGICICSGSLSICTPLNSFVMQRRKVITSIYFTTCNCFLLLLLSTCIFVCLYWFFFWQFSS